MAILNINWKRVCFLFLLKKRHYFVQYYPKYRSIFNMTYSMRYTCSHTGVRVRFAPSPTGMLHIGGLRTALCNYAFARTHKGKFILRIEDTDQARLVPSALEKIQEILCWIGLLPDEGPLNGGEFGPYIQSQRLHLYNERIKILLENNSAYHCFCTADRLEVIRKEAAKGGKIGYDNHCRSLSRAEVKQKLSEQIPYVIRLKIPNEPVTIDDLIYGPKTVNLTEVEGDPILIKSNGFPTYHFANVIDDYEMKITHVLRGVEWHISTFKHIVLYKALGYESPQFGHLPLMLNSDGRKLSKRQGNVAINDYKIKGYYPESILNFVASRGGGFNCQANKLTPIDELINSFSIDEVNRHSPRLQLEVLDDYNRIYIQQQLSSTGGKTLLISQLRSLILNKFKESMNQTQLQEQVLQDEYLNKVLDWSTCRIYSLHDLLKEEFEFLWMIPQTLDFSSIPNTNKQIAKILCDLHAALKDELNTSYSHESLNQFLYQYAQKQKMQYNTFMKLMRIVLSSLKKGPGIVEMIELIGKESTLERLYYAQQWLLKNQLKEEKKTNSQLNRSEQ